jgi:hypothetical protein
MLLARIAPALAVTLMAGGLAFRFTPDFERPATDAMSLKPEPSQGQAAATVMAAKDSRFKASLPPRPESARFADHQSFVVPVPYRAVARIQAKIGEKETIVPGVIIWSSRDEALIVTTTEILDVGPKRGDAPSRHKPSNVKLNLPSSPKKTDGRTGLVAFQDATEIGEPMAYDLQRHVALIRTRTGGRRILPSPIVPRGWKVRGEMQAINVECPKEAYAPMPATTSVSNPQVHGLFGSDSYEGFMCQLKGFRKPTAGALFTNDGFLVGVGNFSDPQGGSAIYAAPQSIHRLLDEAGLSHLIGDEERGSLFGAVDVGGPLLSAIGDVSNEGPRPPGVGRKPSTPPDSIAETDAPAERAESGRIEALERRVEAMDRKLDQILEKLCGSGP